GPRRGARRAEVDQLAGAVGRHDDILRAEIAVNQPERAVEIFELVNMLQRLADVAHDMQRRWYRQTAMPRDELFLHRAQTQPRDVFHRDEVAAIKLAEVDDIDDIGMTETRRQRRFVDEHLSQIRLLLDVGEHGLDDDAP